MITRQDILNKYKLIDGKLCYYKWSRAKKRNRPAGCINSDGYRIIGLMGKRYCESYLLHILEHGTPPTRRSTNTVDNLKPQVNNLIGLKGVSKVKRGYTATVRFNGKKHYAGFSKSPEVAYEMYLKKREELFSKII